MQLRTTFATAVLILASLSARAADLVVWWEKGYNPEEDAAVEEIVAGFEQVSGLRVELTLPIQAELPPKLNAAVEAGRPPDFVYSRNIQDADTLRWAAEDRLIDLTDAFGTEVELFDSTAIAYAKLFNARRGERGIYLLPMGLDSNHLHVWKSLLEQAGFRLDDIPKQWEAFWPFWCEKVQPAVRRALGRDDIWGIGLPMSDRATDVRWQLEEFMLARNVFWFGPDGRLTLDDPVTRAGLVAALDEYTGLYRKGCVPPDAVEWGDPGNNKAFLEQRVVLTANGTLSVPNALRTTRPEDYYKNSLTIGWPATVTGQPLPIRDYLPYAMAFRDGGHPEQAKAFVRFLVEGELARYFIAARDRMLPPMPKLLDQPFWLDPSDPHRMQSVIQALRMPHSYAYPAFALNPSLLKVDEYVWARTIHRIVTEGVTPEQAADEVIARVKQLVNE